MQLQGRDEPLLAGDLEADVPPSSSWIVPRIYSVCASLLYFLFFPCAQTVLSAVACTDTRESDQSYLNLFPAQACDDEWRRTVLPPAVLGLMFWIVAFPLGSTLMLMKLRARVAASSDSHSASASSATFASSASALSVWPVCSDLLLPYSPRFWFWDQLLLLRRLLLVAAVTFIPSSSLYLPLVLFAIIQLSALQQHWAAPYAHPLLNAGELASLYLLLISYISAIILQTGLKEGGFHATANGWAAALYLAFLLILVAGLFGWARQWIVTSPRHYLPIRVIAHPIHGAVSCELSMRPLLRWFGALLLLLLLFAVSLTHASPMSLSAALLSPSTALLQWSASTSVGPLSLSSPAFSSPLLLPSVAAELGHLLITDLRLTTPVHFTLSSSASHAVRSDGLVSSHSAHASLLPSSSDAASASFDLSGARLLPEVACADALCSSRRVRWTASPAAVDSAALPLIYSVFVEWSAPSMSAAAGGVHSDQQTDRQPTISRQSMRICSTHGKRWPQTRIEQNSTEQLMHCDVPADRLPRGVELTLHLLTECDYHQMISADGAATLPHCLSAVSALITVTLPFESVSCESLVSVSLPPPVLLTAPSSTAAITDNSTVHAALCEFFHLTHTNGQPWINQRNWCVSGVSYCQWYGLACNDAGNIVKFDLSANGLGPWQWITVDFVWAVLPHLQLLNISFNRMFTLTSINLSSLTQLDVLDLSNAPTTTIGTKPYVPIPLVMPFPCNLRSFNFSNSFYVYATGIERCVHMQTLILSSAIIWIDLGIIRSFPELVVFDANSASSLVSSVAYSIVSSLTVTNPVLKYFDISYNTMLQFFNGGPDVWPNFNSSTLEYLGLSGCATLYTAQTGPANVAWLLGLPSLRTLNISNMAAHLVRIDLGAFMAAPQLETIVMANTPVTLGTDLTPLYFLSRLRSLTLDASGLSSALPSEISAVWPNLTFLSIPACNLYGPLPHFRQLPLLSVVLLSQNALLGDVPDDFAADSPLLSIVDLGQNQLTGSMPSFRNHSLLQAFSADSNSLSSFPATFPSLPALEVLTLSNNMLDDVIPDDLWNKIPAALTIDFSVNQLIGPIPSPASVMNMFLFSAANNLLTSPVPVNIIPLILDLSYNNIFGPLVLLSNMSYDGPLDLASLNLEGVTNLQCPIHLAMFKQLTTLTLAGGGFSGCNFGNKSTVSLPWSALSTLDISDIQWLPWSLTLPPSLSVLRARNAGIYQLRATSSAYNLQSLTVDQNNLMEQLPGFREMFVNGAFAQLRHLSASDCKLNFAFADFVQLFQFAPTVNFVLEDLLLSNNQLTGPLSTTLFSIAATTVLPRSLRVLDLSMNSIVSRLPVGDSSYSNLQEIDLGGVGIVGPIPASWGSFSALQRLALQSTQAQCTLLVNANKQLMCSLYTWLIASNSSQSGYQSPVDSTASLHCPSISIARSNASTVSMDPFYHAFTLCNCDSGAFGKNGRCYSCPEGCTCFGSVIQNCFPVLRQGRIPVTNAPPDADGNFALSNLAPIVQFELIVFLPCPRTVTGLSLCNPDGIDWSSFYNTTQPFTHTVTMPQRHSLSDERAGIGGGWCYPGHTGRLCAQCSSGYFSSGRWCLKCLSEGVHVVILIANLLVILALIAYLYFKSPKPASAIKALAAYRAKADAATPSSNAPRALVAVSAGDRSYSALADSAQMGPSDADAEPASEAANPLKLLIFHSQQLSLLLQTTASMPNVIAGLMSAVSSGSNGFSLSSLVAMECLNAAWSIQHRCWLAIVAPLLILAFAGLAFLFDRRAASALLNRGGEVQFSRQKVNDREQALLSVTHDAADASPTNSPSATSSSPVSRIYGVCVSLLYLLVFPCAQTALSALTCTDTRERTAGDSRVYLNLFPAQQCDDQWSRTILPPALLGALFWLIVFPLCSTLGLRRLQAQLHSASSDSSAAALSAWPICSDLLSPFSPRFWFWEQILLMRRLMLVAAVTIIPSSSLYLPLALFALIQLCALLQHWTHPYTHAMLNAGELVSLYLLLLNYISALILQTGLTDGGFHQTADLWAVLLFLINFAFLLALGVGLFGFIRKWAVNKLSQRRGGEEKTSVRL